MRKETPKIVQTEPTLPTKAQLLSAKLHRKSKLPPTLEEVYSNCQGNPKTHYPSLVQYFIKKKYEFLLILKNARSEHHKFCFIFGHKCDKN